MMSHDKIYEFMEIGKSQIMVAEIRPLQIPVVFQKTTYLTTKWMNFHIWQEVYILLNNITKEYKNNIRIFKPCQIKTYEGKSVKLRYRFTPYQGISTEYLNDCMEDFSLYHATPQKGKRKTDYVPSSHSLIVSVCPQKSISNKYQIASVPQMKKTSQGLIHELELRIKSEIGYLSNSLSKYQVFSSSFSLEDTKLSKKRGKEKHDDSLPSPKKEKDRCKRSKRSCDSSFSVEAVAKDDALLHRNVASPDCKEEITPEKSSQSESNLDEDNYFLGFDEEDQYMLNMDTRLFPTSLLGGDTSKNLVENTNEEMPLVKEKLERSSELTISSLHSSKGQSSCPNYLTALGKLTDLTAKKSLKQKRATSKTKMKEIPKNQKLSLKLKQSRKISMKSTDENSPMFDGFSASSSKNFNIQDSDFKKELCLSPSPLANNNRSNETLNIANETQNPALQIPQNLTTHIAESIIETCHQNKDTTLENIVISDGLQDDTKSSAIAVSSSDYFIKNLTDVTKSKNPIEEKSKENEFQLKDCLSNLASSVTLTSNCDLLQKEDSKIPYTSSNVLLNAASQNTCEMLIKSGGIFTMVSSLNLRMSPSTSKKCDKFSFGNSNGLEAAFQGNLTRIEEKAWKFSTTNSKMKVDGEDNMSNLDINDSSLPNFKNSSFTTQLLSEEFGKDEQSEKFENSTNSCCLLDTMLSGNTSQRQSQIENETKMDDNLGKSTLSNDGEANMSNLDIDGSLPNLIIPSFTTQLLSEEFGKDEQSEKFENSTNSCCLLDTMTSGNTSQRQSQIENETKMDDNLGKSTLSNDEEANMSNLDFDDSLPNLIIPSFTTQLLSEEFGKDEQSEKFENSTNSCLLDTMTSGNTSQQQSQIENETKMDDNLGKSTSNDGEANMSNLDIDGSLKNVIIPSFTTQPSREDFAEDKSEKFKNSAYSSYCLVDSMISENTTKHIPIGDETIKMDGNLGKSPSSNSVFQASAPLLKENFLHHKKNESSEMFVSTLDDLSQSNSGLDDTSPDMLPLSTSHILDDKNNIHPASGKDEEVLPALSDASIVATQYSDSGSPQRMRTRSGTGILQLSSLKNKFPHSTNASPEKNIILQDSTIDKLEMSHFLQDDANQQESTAKLPVSTRKSVVQNKIQPNVYEKKSLSIEDDFQNLSKDVSENQGISKNSKNNFLEKSSSGNTQNTNKSFEELSNKSNDASNYLPDLMLHSTSPSSNKLFPSSQSQCTKHKDSQDKIVSEVGPPTKGKKELKMSQNDQKLLFSQKKGWERKGYTTRSSKKLFTRIPSCSKDVQSTYSKKQCSKNENSNAVENGICSGKDPQGSVKSFVKSSTKFDEKIRSLSTSEQNISRDLGSDIGKSFRESKNDEISQNSKKYIKLESQVKKEGKDNLHFTHDNFPLSSTPISSKQPSICKYFSRSTNLKVSPAKKNSQSGKSELKVKQRKETRNIFPNSPRSSFETSCSSRVTASRKEKRKRSCSSSAMCSKTENKSKFKTNHRAGKTVVPQPPGNCFRKKKSVSTSNKSQTLKSHCNYEYFKIGIKRNEASLRFSNKLTKNTPNQNDLGKQTKSPKRKKDDNFQLQDIPDLPDLRVPCINAKNVLPRERYHKKNKIMQDKYSGNNKDSSNRKIKLAKKVKESKTKKNINSSDLDDSLPVMTSNTSFDLNQESERMEDSSNLESLSRLLSPVKTNYEGAFLQTVKEEIKRLTDEEYKLHIRQNLPHFKNVVKEKIFNARNKKLRMGPNIAFWFTSQKFYCLFDHYDPLIDLVSEEVKTLITQVDQHLSVRVYTAEVIIPELLKKILLSFSFVREKGISTDEECERVFDSLMAHQD